MSGKSRGHAADRKSADTVPDIIAPEEDAPVIETEEGSFDLEDPNLPDWVKEGALTSDGFPYDKRLKKKAYEEELRQLQIELVKLQKYAAATEKLRIVALFEGRDAAGKGGSIKVFRENMNPRAARTVALPKPSETERGQWYFQRYVANLPAAGEIVLFDRSWYNRAGVEPVMGYCTPEQTRSFLKQVPGFEEDLVEDGILLFKFWLDIGRTTQLQRFHDRRHNPLKIWKLSPVDYAALTRWDDYSRARDMMLDRTHTHAAPWTVVRANDKRRARLEIIRHVLSGLDYPGKDSEAIGTADRKIIGSPSIIA